ncbi:MAG: HNH endonuclease [Candidatus Nanopelagicales bacterium]|nr:HNH endonuclease [Candidatus Nanopelagicales bacterium]
MPLEISQPALRRIRLGGELPTEHPAVLDDISALIDELPDPENLCAEERVGALRAAHVLATRLTAYLTTVAGSCDRHADASLLRAGTTGMLVAAATGLNPRAGSGMVNTANALRKTPHIAAAWAAGRISDHHVRILLAALPRLDDPSSLEEALVTVAEKVEPAELTNLTALLIAQSRPQSQDDAVERQRDKRGATLTENANGTFRLDALLDSIAGRRLARALEAFTSAPAPGDPRSPAQRRADALNDLASAAMANRGQLGGSQITVLVDLENLPKGSPAVLDDGTPIGPANLDLLACAAVASVVFGVNRDGIFLPLALGRSRRRASAAQWVALIARDRGCIRCGRSPRFCEAHHIVHWKNGGATDLENLVLMCSRCHHDLHLGLYNLTVAANGVVQVNPTPVVRLRT